MAPTALVQVEITHSAWDDLAGLTKAAQKAALKAVKIIRALDLVGLHAHPGLNFEKLVNLIDPVSKQPLYSFRFGKGHRAICTLETGPLVVVGMFIADHGKAYRP